MKLLLKFVLLQVVNLLFVTVVEWLIASFCVWMYGLNDSMLNQGLSLLVAYTLGIAVLYRWMQRTYRDWRLYLWHREFVK